MCASFKASHGKYVPASPFVPFSGTLKTTGGKGSAGKWQISIAFDLTGVSGSQVEQLGYRGKAKASLGKARKPSSACKAVLKLLG